MYPSWFVDLAIFCYPAARWGRGGSAGGAINNMGHAAGG